MESLILKAALALGVIPEDELRKILLRDNPADEVELAIAAAKILNKDRDNEDI